MKFALKKLNTATGNFLRACGYLQIVNPHNQETSFVRSLYTDRFYPRFHIYPEEKSDQIIINLHLDAKKPSYEGTTAHSGEYDGELVEEEAQGIMRIAARFASQPPPADQKIGFQNKKSWWQKFFS